MNAPSRVSQLGLATFVASAALAAFLTAQAQQESTAALDDQSFASQAAAQGAEEVALAELALQKSRDQDVRQFAQRIVKDHTAMDTKLKAIAAQEDLTLPEQMKPERQAVKQKLTELKGDEFDTAYGAEMAKGRDEAVALFESASQSPSVSEELRTFAAATLPVLRDQEQLARQLHGDEEDTASR